MAAPLSTVIAAGPAGSVAPTVGGGDEIAAAGGGDGAGTDAGVVVVAARGAAVGAGAMGRTGAGAEGGATGAVAGALAGGLGTEVGATVAGRTGIGAGGDTGVATPSPDGPAFRLRVTSAPAAGAGARIASGGVPGAIDTGLAFIGGLTKGTAGGVTGAEMGAAGLTGSTLVTGAPFRFRVRSLPGLGAAGRVWVSAGEAISRAAQATGIFIAGVSRLVRRTARPWAG